MVELLHAVGCIIVSSGCWIGARKAILLVMDQYYIVVNVGRWKQPETRATLEGRIY